MKIVSILGSTGSIGINTLNVIRLNKNLFDIFGLSCNKNIELLIKQALEFNPRYIYCSSLNDSKKLKKNLPSTIRSKILYSKDSNNFLASHQDVTHVVAGISGSAGLESTYYAAKEKKIILLANKESMVMAGPLIMNLIKKNRNSIIPIDSEHNAIFQVLQGESNSKKFLKKIILTASGGPFLDTPLEKLESVTVSDALNHPNWAMGKKVTIDSATMMNKGLEVIEASFLFDLPADRIEVLIHPQSIIHSMVEFADGSYLTQMGNPDMRTPISFALGYPNRLNSGVNSLNFSEINLSFFQPNYEKYPLLPLAFSALRLGHSHCIALNTINEIAVNAFLKKKIKFTSIYEINTKILNSINKIPINSIDDIFEYDSEIKIKTHEFIKKFY
jgi:1-deoxy-D-xylulose-5-phosphate reductoisomerase